MGDIILTDEKYNDLMDKYNNVVKHNKPSAETQKRLTNLEMNIEHIKEDIKKINDRLCNVPTKQDLEIMNLKLIEQVSEKTEEKYVSQLEFTPIKRIVYGVVALILTSVFVGLLALILK